MICEPKALLLGLLLLFGASSPARPATPLEDYLATRDRAVASLASDTDDTAASDAREKAALADLQARLRQLIGPIGIPGFPNVGTINLETLSPGVGLGKLDALTAVAADRTTAFVTTLPLLRRWLSDHKDQSSTNSSSVTDVASAFASGDFYTFSISSDAAAHVFARVPLTPRPGDEDATAVLILYSQDAVAPHTPDELAVAVVRADRVIILTQKTKVAEIPACKAAWQRDNGAADKVFAAYQKSHASDKALFEQYTKLQAAADDAFVSCFDQKFSSVVGYAATVRQAKNLLNRVPQ